MIDAYTLRFFNEWLAHQPEPVHQTVERCPPWGIYRFQDPSIPKLHGLLCTVASYAKDGTMNVRFTMVYAPEILLSSVTPEQLYFTPPQGQVN
jgi:hypothetical protein